MMWNTRFASVGMAALAVLAGAGTAAAEAKKSEGSSRGGALSQVVSGMKQQSGQGGGDRASNTPDSRSDSSASVGTYDAPAYSNRAGAYDPTEVAVVGPGYGPGRDARVSLYLGLQRVADSNGAAIASVRASSGDYGLILSDTAYYERVRTATGSETLDLHVWTVGGAYRAYSGSGARGRAGREVWLTAGLAGANSDGLQLFGAAVGVEFEQPVRGALGTFAAGRYLLYQDDIRGVELRAGVAASILRVSYRHTEFNVGPPLRGPEVGIALRF